MTISGKKPEYFSLAGGLLLLASAIVLLWRCEDSSSDYVFDSVFLICALAAIIIGWKGQRKLFIISLFMGLVVVLVDFPALYTWVHHPDGIDITTKLLVSAFLVSGILIFSGSIIALSKRKRVDINFDSI